MNGQQQKERQTAVARLDRDVKKLEESITEAWGVEVDARMKAIDNLRDELLLAIARETDKRTAHVKGVEINHYQQCQEILAAVIHFVRLPWWERYVWAIAGAANMQRVHQFVSWVKGRLGL